MVCVEIEGDAACIKDKGDNMEDLKELFHQAAKELNDEMMIELL